MERYDKPMVHDSVIGTHRKTVWCSDGKFYARFGTGTIEVKPDGYGEYESVRGTLTHTPRKPFADRNAARAAMIERCRRMNGTR